MYNLETLKNMRNGSKQAVYEMQTRFNELQAQSEKIKSDTSLSADYKSSKLAELFASDYFSIKVRSVNETAAKVSIQAEQWESKPLLLSRQKFDTDTINDSIIKARYLAELELMPAGVLQLTADAAIHENNLPLIYLCSIVAADKPEVSVNLDDVTVPAQVEGLAIIKEVVQALPAQAELLFHLGSGKEITAAQKLNIAYMSEA